MIQWDGRWSILAQEGLDDDGTGADGSPRPEVSAAPYDEEILQAGGEALRTLELVSRDDKDWVKFNFQYPILFVPERATGTVSYTRDYRSKKRTGQVEIRLRHDRSDKLQKAAEQLIKDITGPRIDDESTPSPKISGFQKIRVLEPHSTSEAFTGEVISSKFRVTLRERRRDLNIALTFLGLAAAVMIAGSPFLLNVDEKTHAEVWTNGWFGWFGGNLERIGSALIVGIVLPVTSILLHWSDRRRAKSRGIVWDV